MGQRDESAEVCLLSQCPTTPPCAQTGLYEQIVSFPTKFAQHTLVWDVDLWFVLAASSQPCQHPCSTASSGADGSVSLSQQGHPAAHREIHHQCWALGLLRQGAGPLCAVQDHQVAGGRAERTT